MAADDSRRCWAVLEKRIELHVRVCGSRIASVQPRVRREAAPVQQRQERSGFASDFQSAAPYFKQCQHSKQFKDLVTQYNKARTDAGKKPIVIALDGIERIDPKWVAADAIRGFNGYGGTDSLGQLHSVHEFDVPLDARKLVVDVNEDKLRGRVHWRRTPVSRRYTTDGRPIGDPNYVAHIEQQRSF
jgi:hypothetical protein